jgi:hypothetical protein
MVVWPFPNPVPVASLRVRDAYGTTISLSDAAEAAWMELPMAHWDPVHAGYTYTGLGRNDCEDTYLRPWHSYWLGVYGPGITLVFPEPGSRSLGRPIRKGRAP